MDPLTDEFKKAGERTVQSLREDLKLIRTGRATSALIEGLPVSTYGGQTTLKLMEISTITTEGPTTLVIMPFDPATVPDIEKAILKSSLGLSPQLQGSRILVKIPPLSEEQREKLVKLVGQKVEERRVTLRGYRDEARRKIKARLEKKEIAEDSKFRFEKEIDTASQLFMEEVQNLKEVKEREIREV